MRADAPVLVAGVASFPRVEAEKRPRALCPVGVINNRLSQGNTGIISVRLSCTTMKNSRTYIFSYAPIPKLMPRHYITDTRQKEFHSSIQGVPRRLSRPSRDPLRNGPPRAKEATPDTRRVEGTKEHAMKVAAAESAVLDSAAQREDERSEARKRTLTRLRC